MSNPIVLIPARMAATRFPNKPLAPILGEPMILHVLRRAKLADIGRVVVAAGDREIVDVVRDAGGEAVLTDPDLPNGTSRIAAALADLDPNEDHDVVVNLQGDLPTLVPRAIQLSHTVLCAIPEIDITTLAAPIADPAEAVDPNVVKAIIELEAGDRSGRALYFTRATAPHGPGPFYHHIGLYTFRRRALERYVALPVGVLERRERLEQLRALAAGMRIEVCLVDTVPLGVDTPADLGKAQAILMSGMGDPSGGPAASEGAASEGAAKGGAASRGANP